MIRPLEPWETEALESLGMALSLTDDVLTITFRNGATERWLSLPGTVADWPGLELLTLSERVFARVDADRPRVTWIEEMLQHGRTGLV